MTNTHIEQYSIWSQAGTREVLVVAVERSRVLFSWEHNDALKYHALPINVFLEKYTPTSRVLKFDSFNYIVKE
jgi:hypothetical protein